MFGVVRLSRQPGQAGATSAFVAEHNLENAGHASANGISTIEGLPADLHGRQAFGRGLAQPEVGVGIRPVEAADRERPAVNPRPSSE